MVDPISDMLTRIRNAQAVGHATVSFPFSKIKFELLNILSKQGFIHSVSKKGKGVKKAIEAVLKYKDEKSIIPAIQGLKRISKPGQRIYAIKKDLSKFLKERGITILSTSQGLMTVQDGRKKGLGGEVLCRIW